MGTGDNSSSVDMAKFLLYKELMCKWDRTLTVGGFLFITTLAIFLFLSFVGIVQMTEALQIFVIGVIMFVLVFRYFKELTVGTISGKTSLPIGPLPAIRYAPPPPPMNTISVHITSPTNGETISQDVDWIADVKRDENLKSLGFFLDSQPVKYLTCPPYKINLEAAKLKKGPHKIQVIAFRIDDVDFGSEIVEITKV